MFWSRGNGWVMGGIVRTFDYLPKDDPARMKYVTQLKEMAARGASLQGPDGLWRDGMLGSGNYSEPATSGAALFTTAQQWGVNSQAFDGEGYRRMVGNARSGLSQL